MPVVAQASARRTCTVGTGVMSPVTQGQHQAAVGKHLARPSHWSAKALQGAWVQVPSRAHRQVGRTAGPPAGEPALRPRRRTAQGGGHGSCGSTPAPRTALWRSGWAQLAAGAPPAPARTPWHEHGTAEGPGCMAMPRCAGNPRHFAHQAGSRNGASEARNAVLFADTDGGRRAACAQGCKRPCLAGVGGGGGGTGRAGTGRACLHVGGWHVLARRSSLEQAQQLGRLQRLKPRHAARERPQRALLVAPGEAQRGCMSQQLRALPWAARRMQVSSCPLALVEVPAAWHPGSMG